MKKYIFLYLITILIIALSGCSRADIESCTNNEEESIIAITNALREFYTNWNILQMWGFSWLAIMIAKIRRSS